MLSPAKLEQAGRRKNFLNANAAWRERITAANESLQGVLHEWPQPRFLSDELERVAAAEISERPLHGVPSIYRTALDSLTRIAAEKNACDERARAGHIRTVAPTFLSVADQEAIAAKLRKSTTGQYERRELVARLMNHRRYPG